jgi:hypothetical protein
MLTPDLIGRDEIRGLLSSWDSECWLAEAHSPFWHNEVEPRVGGRVLVCLRVPDGYGWTWCQVSGVMRWRVQVDMYGGPPGSKLTAGSFPVDREHIHVTLPDEPASAAYATWHRAWSERRNKPAATAAPKETAL